MSAGTGELAPRRRAGVRDVAQLAGVSPQTVSRVLNGHPSIKPETRERVQQVLDELDYRVNNAARTLGTSSTRTIGIISGDPSLYGPGAGLVALASAARQAGRWIATAYADSSDAASVREAAEYLLTQGIDGLIVTAACQETMQMLLGANYGVPIRALHDGEGRAAQVQAAALAVQHLVGLGHSRIAVVSGPSLWLEALSRAEGIDGALLAEGLQPVLRLQAEWTAASGSALAEELAAAVASKEGPTAVVAPNDQTALGVISGLRDRGVRVPQDVSIVGFDDIPDAPFLVPALTTVRVDIVGEARRCVAEITGEFIEQAPEPPELVVRASTAAAPRA